MSERDNSRPGDELDREFDPIVGAHDGESDNGRVDAGVASAVPDTTNALNDLVLFLVRNLVDDPDAVKIDVQQRGSLVQIQLRLPEEEIGKVIGRGGRIAKSMRTALMIAGSRHHLRISLDIES